MPTPGDREAALYETIVRVPPARPLSPMQHAVAILVGLNLSYEEIAENLGITRRTVIYHLRMAARRIPGNLTPKVKVAVWARGATLDVLTGGSLFSEVHRQARAGRREPMFAGQ